MQRIFLLLFFCFSLYAEQRDHQGQLTFEVRQFEDDENDETFENQRSLFIKYKTKKKSEKIFSVIAFAGRYDDQDPERNHLWPEDVYLQVQTTENLSVSAGTQVFTYSYLEAFNPLDIVNSRIIDVSVLNADKLGELFLGLEYYVWDGDLKFYFLPYATAPILPGKDSRLNLDQDFNDPVWIGQEGIEDVWTDNFVLSFEKSLEAGDLLFVTSKSYDRTRLLIGTDDYSEFGTNVFPNTKDLYTPFYYERYMTGLSYVHNFDSFQFKTAIAYSYYLAEDAIYTSTGLQSPKDYSNAVLGIEKGVEHSNGLSSNITLEVQKIFVDKEDEKNFLAQNDLFFGWKLNFNDVNSKEITLATLLDMSNTELEGFMNLEYEQRLVNVWKIEFGVVKYYVPSDSTITGIGLFEDKEHAYLNLSRFF